MIKMDARLLMGALIFWAGLDVVLRLFLGKMFVGPPDALINKAQDYKGCGAKKNPSKAGAVFFHSFNSSLKKKLP